MVTQPVMYPASTSAPLLTVDSVLKYVQGVKNWRKVGKMLLGYGSDTTLDEIERKFSSIQDRFQAVVQQWLKGRPSWRELVWSLDHSGDIGVADPIQGFTEALPGESS